MLFAECSVKVRLQPVIGL